MTTRAKYIVTEFGPIVFSEQNAHLAVAAGIKTLNKKIFSAGFVVIDNELQQCICDGKSESLKIESAPKKDSFVLTEFIFNDNHLFRYHLTTYEEFYKQDI